MCGDLWRVEDESTLHQPGPMEADTQVPEKEDISYIDTTSRGQREEYEGKLKPKQMKREGGSFPHRLIS